MTFDEWWTETMGDAPADQRDMARFETAYLAWRAALTIGEWEPRSKVIESALKRVGEGESDYSDELLLRRRIANSEALLSILSDTLEHYEAQAGPPESEPALPSHMPKGAIPINDRAWRCPRCNFMVGIKRFESTCRACGFPGDDIRDWGGENEEKNEEKSTAG
jgi:ribosomal protein L37E